MNNTETAAIATRFDLAGYRRLLGDLRQDGYCPRHFDDPAPPAAHDLLLRHDVDYCLASAVAMAQVEASMNIESTWFILVRSPLFNPFGAGEREQLQSLRQDGGRIGLQFDASYYPHWIDDVEALQRAATQEIEALEIASDGPVVAISFHKPPQSLQNLASRFCDRPHCSQPHFMRDILYCSDTLAQFSYGEPLDKARAEEWKAMQLLTHPIWWSENADMTGLAKLDALAHRRAAAAHEAIERSVTAYSRFGAMPRSIGTR